MRSSRRSWTRLRNHLSTLNGMNPNGNTSRSIGHIDISINLIPPNNDGWKIFRPISRNSDFTLVKHCGSMLNDARITFCVENSEDSYVRVIEARKMFDILFALCKIGLKQQKISVRIYLFCFNIAIWWECSQVFAHLFTAVNDVRV